MKIKGIATFAKDSWHSPQPKHYGLKAEQFLETLIGAEILMELLFDEQSGDVTQLRLETVTLLRDSKEDSTKVLSVSEPL